MIRIYSLQGQLVEERRMAEIPDGPLEWRLENYSNGLYLAVLFVEGQQVQTGRFVVERR